LESIPGFLKSLKIPSLAFFIPGRFGTCAACSSFHLINILIVTIPFLLYNLDSESIERFIEDQAFSPWCDLAPPPPPPLLPSFLSFSVFLCVAGQAY
jgi:hypothetical protein